MSNRKLFRIKNNWQSVFVGIVGGFIIAFAVLMILSAVMVNYDIPSDSVKYFWFIISAISGFSAGAITGRLVKAKCFLWGSVAAGVLSLVCASMLTAINAFDVDFILLLMIPVCIVTGCVGGIISSNFR